MSGPPVVITTSLGRPVTNVASLNGALPMVVVDALGEPVTLVDALGEPVTLLNPDGTLWGDLYRILALSPSLLIWPENGSGWQGTSGGDLSAIGQPVGLLTDLAALGGKTQAEWLASAPELKSGWASSATWAGITGAVFSGTSIDFDATSDRAYTTVTANTTYVLTIGGVFASGGQLRFDDDGTGVGLGSITDYISLLSAGGVIVFRTTASTRLRIIQVSVSGTISVNSFSLKALPGNHLRAGTWASPADSSRALLTADGALNFDGVNDYMSLLNAISITENMTVVRAFKRSAAGINSIGAGRADATVRHDLFWFGFNNTRYTALGDVQGNWGASTSTGSFVSTNARNATEEKLRLNGTAVSAAKSPGAVSSSLTALGRYDGNYNSGEISFLAVFPTELTGANLALVEQIAAATNGAVIA